MRSFLFALIASLAAIAPLRAATVTVPDTDVTFRAPEGFTSLSRQELDIKFPSKTGPSFAVGNERRTTTVAYDVKDVAITIEALESQLNALGEAMGRAIPGVAWVDRKIVQIGGQSWAYFEMTSTAIDADIHNIVLMTPFRGKMIVFNFNATKSDFVKLESELRASIQSIDLGR